MNNSIKDIESQRGQEHKAISEENYEQWMTDGEEKR